MCLPENWLSYEIVNNVQFVGSAHISLIQAKPCNQFRKRNYEHVLELREVWESSAKIAKTDVYLSLSIAHRIFAQSQAYAFLFVQHVIAPLPSEMYVVPGGSFFSIGRVVVLSCQFYWVIFMLLLFWLLVNNRVVFSEMIIDKSLHLFHEHVTTNARYFTRIVPLSPCIDFWSAWSQVIFYTELSVILIHAVCGNVEWFGQVNLQFC